MADVRRKLSRKELLQETIKHAFCSTEFKEFESRGFKGSSHKVFLDSKEGKVELKDLATKATVDTSSHTGTVMISEISDVVRDDEPNRMNHVRDLMNVSMTDQAQIVAGQVYDFTDALTLGAVVLAENGDFDNVNSASATFLIDFVVVPEPQQATSIRWSLEDVNHDGTLDLVFHFLTQELTNADGSPAPAWGNACLIATVDGQLLPEICDAARFFFKGCDKGPHGQNNQIQNQQGPKK